MSCSTTSLSACTLKNTVTSEDPYVFTETAPTTPPTLFNNSQKSRNRLVVKQINISPTVTVDKTQNSNKDSSSYAKVKSHGAKTQTPPSLSLKSTALSTSAVLGVINTNNIKYGPQSPKLQLESNQAKHTQHVLLAQNENAAALSTLVATPPATGVISSRNVQQQKPQIQQKNHLQNPQQSQTPPPLLLSHTPSLWQTPLLLESPSVVEPPTLSPTPTTATTKSTALLKDGVSTTSFVSSLKRTPIKISFQPPTPTLATALITPIAIPAVTTGTATNSSIAPLHLIMPSAAPLPPSNFHNTTLAQHLQKVQCLKKSKKSNTPNALNITTQKPETTSKALSASSSLTETAPKSISKTTTQHSTTDLNEIPVNVIFRSPTKTNVNEKSPNPISTSDDKTKNRQMSTNNIKRLPSESNVGIGTIQSPKQSSKSLQKRKNSSTACDGQQIFTHVTQPKQCKLQKSAVKSIAKPVLQKLVPNEQLKDIPILALTDTTMKPGKDTLPVKPHKTGSKRKTSGIGQKTQKRNSKISFHPRSLDDQEQSEFLMAEDVSLTTKAVAVIRMPYKEIEADITVLAEESVLPYCVQKHWFNINDRSIRSAAVGREERIIEYKNLLRRQAMQLLATRSLQQLPFHIARKRLLSVDSLLRKYRDHNKAIVGSMIKQCEVGNCANAALQMSTYCQQHIMKNTKQCILVQCSAKNLRDNQKSCDVPVLNILKPYSVPLCFLHAGHHRHNSTNTIKATSFSNQSTPYLTTQANSSKRVVAAKNTPSRKRKASTAAYTKNTSNMPNLLNVNILGTDTLPMRKEVGLQRKNSTTSLESIASNSHSSFASSIQPKIANESTAVASLYKKQISNANTFQTNMLSPPSLAPLSYNNIGIVNNHVNSNGSYLESDFSNSSHRENIIFGNGTLDPTAEQEINKLVAQFAMAAAATAPPTNNNSSCNGSGNNNNNNNNSNSFNFMNTNSNSNLTSSGVGSSSSLPSTDELLTQDMLSICENSSAYASSSEDTGLGELSENELVGARGVGNVGCGSGLNDDDVSPDEIPLGDTRLLEENDLVNVFGTLPVNLNELFTTVVRQDEREEVERALELADKHLKTLQETIGSDSDFLADFLNVNDDMLANTDDICSKMEIVSSVLSPSESLEATTMYLENNDNVLNMNHHGTKNVAITGNCVNTGNSNNSGVMDIRGLLQT